MSFLRRLVVIGLVVVLGTAALLVYAIHRDRERIVQRWQDRLEHVAAGQARIVEAWVGERRADINALARHPTVLNLLRAAGDGDPIASLSRRASGYLETVARLGRYQSLIVLDRSGRAVAGAGPGQVPGLAPPEDPRDTVELAWDREAALVKFTRPVTADPEAPPLGSVAVYVRPETALVPLVRAAGIPTRSAETLLVAPDGNQAVFLTPPRHLPEARPGYRRPLDTPAFAASLALAGDEAFGEFVDYRGEPVFAATRYVPGLGWGLVRKVDFDEAMTEFHRVAQVQVGAGILALAGFGGLLGVLWRGHEGQMLRERLDQQAALVAARTYAEAIVASVPAGLLLLSGDLHAVSANAAFRRILGPDSPDPTGRPLGDVVPAPGLVKRAAAVLDSGTPMRDVDIDLGPSRRPLRVSIVPAPSRTDGARLLLVAEDLTELEQLRAKAGASEQRFRATFEQAGVGIALVDPDDRWLWVNERLGRVLGRRPQELLGGAVRDVIHPEDVDADAVALGKLLAGEIATHSAEKRYLRPDGSHVWVEVTASVVRRHDGTPAYRIDVVEDVTSRKRAEESLLRTQEQLREVQKMEAVGRLAGGVAHDFNNILTAVMGYSDLLLRRLGPQAPEARQLLQIRKAADRAASLTRQLLAFSRRQVLQPKVLDLNAVIEDMDEMLRRLIGEQVELRLSLHTALGQVKADPGQLAQVLLNLAVNARDAMPQGGSLSLETSHAWLDGREHVGLAPGPYVVLTVSDDGVGMDERTLSQVFEPFFTTKPQGQGTGLGLSTVHGIVRQSGGDVRVTSEPGRGTTFTICLPRVDETPAAEPSVASPAECRGSETVLLVEDEDDVRELARESLELHGYRVLAASGPIEALRVAAAEPQIDLVLTDVVMPGMTGTEMVHTLRARRSGLRVLFMSGYAEDIVVHDGVLGPGIEFLAKPFSPDALARKVREALDGPGAEPQNT